MKSLSKIALSAFLIASLPVFAGVPGLGLPKTSKHESFKPEDFERIAVIVKPFKAQLGGGGFDPTTGLSTGTIHLQTGQHHNQTQPERLVEQRFMRVLLGDGYTLVSRTDLDAAMKEKGLDEANLTDEKLTQEAAKFLHVSAILVVSVDDYKTTTLQREVTTTKQNQGIFGGGRQLATYYQIVASLSARLIRIDNNMVMWTADVSLNQAYGAPDQDGTILGAMSEALSTAFPPLHKKQ